MEQEVWKDVIGFEGLYQVSSLGKVKSVRRNRLLCFHNTSNGYYQVHFHRDGKATYEYVHRVVAKAFLPEPLPEQIEVNHKDENRHNNAASNLNWCTPSENRRWGNCQQKQHDAKARNGKTKPVAMLSQSGSVVAVFPGLHAAERATGARRACISRCCRGTIATAKGYVWKYITAQQAQKGGDCLEE